MGVAGSRWWVAASVMMIAAGWTPHAASAATATVVAPLTSQSFVSRSPLAFEPNLGQNDGRVWFVSRDPGYSLCLTARGAVLGLSGNVRPVKLNWLGAANRPHARGESLLPTKHNILHGNDSKRWRFNLPTYAKVHYRDLYPGVDLIYYGRQRHLEYDLVVAPGADPAVIRLRVTGVDGLKLDDGGALRLQVRGRSLILDTPVIYQQTAAGKQPVKGGYVLLADDEVGFRLGGYDHSRPLIIDPVLSYAGFLGGSGLDQGKGVAVDGSGNIYIVGQTASADFPLSAKTGTDTDVFVSKFNAAGTLLATSYLGGAGTDRGYAIAVDDADSAVYLTGDTDSTDFPVLAAGQATSGGDIDAFVVKLNSADLSLGFATYLGGIRAEEALGIAVDGSGNAYVAGATLSSNFPSTVGGTFNAGSTGNNCDDPSNPGTKIPCSDAYVAKYDSSGVKQYATLLGGKYEEVATAIAVNGSNGEAYITGITYSTNTDFPVTSSGFQQQHAGGFGDAFILKLTSTGAVGYGTYLGGGGWDQGQAIALDGSGNVYVAGATNSGSNSTSLPVPSASVQRQFGGGTYDAFVAKVTPSNATSSQLRYLTYLGGSGKDFAFGIAADSSGNAYVVGETTSTDFPLQSALQSTWFGDGSNKWGDAFVTKIDSSGYKLNWSTYLGGSDDDWANGVALDGSGGIYVVGSSYSMDFPSVNPYQSTNAGGSDALLVKLTDSALTTDLQVSVSASPDPVGSGETLSYQVVVTNLNTTHAAAGVVIAATLPNGVSYQSATPAGECSAAGAQVTCSLGSIAAGGSASIALATVSNTAGDITFTAKVVRAGQPDPDVSNNSASITTKAAVGSSGGGAWSLYWLIVISVVGAFRVRHGVIQRQS